MPTLEKTVAGFLASKEYDAATVSRCGFWVDELGDIELKDITTEAVDAALVRLAERGRLQGPGKKGASARATGKGLKPSTFNRYVGQLGSLYRYAKRLRLLPRAFVPPTMGLDREPEEVRHDRYISEEQFERLMSVAELVDVRWGRMPALLVLAFHTGLRKSNLLDLHWRDIDLEARTVSVARTKNGTPQVSALSNRAADALKALPGQHPDAYVFPGPHGRAMDIRRLWALVCREAGVTGRTFHSLRHGCGTMLARHGVNQASIMAHLGHRTLSASQRYLHANAADKRAVVDAVFK